MTDRLTEIAIELAQLSGLDRQRYDYVNQYGLHGDPWSTALYNDIEAKKLALVKEYQALGGNVYSTGIMGEASPSKSHYDLDDAIRTRFGKKVSCDSESGCLFIDVDPRYAEEVYDALRDLDPMGRFSMDDKWEDEGKDCFYTPRTDVGGNWPSMAQFLEDRGIEQQQLDLSEAPSVSPEQVQQGKKELERAIYKMYPQLTEQKMRDLLPLVEELLEGFVDWADAES